MKKISQDQAKWLVVLVSFFVGMALSAFPIKTWRWVAPSVYGNGIAIPATDVLSYNLYCGDVLNEYPFEIVLSSNTPPSIEDMAFVVNGVPGDYHCALTAVSSVYNSESDLSNIHTFTVTPVDLGFVPMPPTLLGVE